MICALLPPIARPASTYSCPLMLRAVARTMRVSAGMPAMPMAKIMLKRLCPKAAAMQMDIKRLGIEAKTSTPRMMILSILPP